MEKVSWEREGIGREKVKGGRIHNGREKVYWDWDGEDVRCKK